MSANKARIVNVFKNNKSQAVRIPKDIEFDDAEKVEILRVGRSIVIRPVKEKRTWDEIFEQMKPYPEFEPERWDEMGSRFLDDVLSDAGTERTDG